MQAAADGASEGLPSGPESTGTSHVRESQDRIYDPSGSNGKIDVGSRIPLDQMAKNIWIHAPAGSYDKNVGWI